MIWWPRRHLTIGHKKSAIRPGRPNKVALPPGGAFRTTDCAKSVAGLVLRQNAGGLRSVVDGTALQEWDPSNFTYVRSLAHALSEVLVGDGGRQQLPRTS
jgi:hypothetical protein